MTIQQREMEAVLLDYMRRLNDETPQTHAGRAALHCAFQELLRELRKVRTQEAA